MSIKYYSLQRPVSIGTYPDKAKVLNVVNFPRREFVASIGRWAWGYIECEKPLLNWDCNQYNLEPEPYATLELQFVGVDSHYRYTYKDQNGKLWKNTLCLAPAIYNDSRVRKGKLIAYTYERKVCEDEYTKGNMYDVAGNAFDGEPDMEMPYHYKVEYVEG